MIKTQSGRNLAMVTQVVNGPAQSSELKQMTQGLISSLLCSPNGTDAEE